MIERFIFVFFILLLFVFQCNQNNKLKNSIENQKQNYTALLDTVTKRVNKSNEVFYEIANLQTSLNDLKTFNKALYDEVRKMKGDVKTISKFDIVGIRTDTIYSKENTIIYKLDTNKIDGVLIKNTEIPFAFFEGDSNNLLEIKGKTFISNDSVANSFIDYRKIKINVVTGIYTEKGISKIFVKTNAPFLQIENIEGAVLEKKKFNRLFLGPTITYGVGLDGQLRPLLGFSIGYNLIKKGY